MKIAEFVQNFKDKKVMNSKVAPDAVQKYIEKELEIKTYIPFNKKREIAEMIVAQNIRQVDGIKKYDNINGYVALVVASIAIHTNLEFGTDPVADYDLLAESGLLSQIIAEFKGSHDEIDIILKMALDMELEDNNVSALIGRFLNKISGVLDNVSEVVKENFENFNPDDPLGADFKKEDLAKLSSFLNKYSK